MLPGDQRGHGVGQRLGLLGHVGEELPDLLRDHGISTRTSTGTSTGTSMVGGGFRPRRGARRSGLGLAQPLLEAGGLVGEQKPGHEQHPSLGDAPDLARDGMASVSSMAAAERRCASSPGWQATSKWRPPMVISTCGISAPPRPGG
jgi:hypothetical protein